MKLVMLMFSSSSGGGKWSLWRMILTMWMSWQKATKTSADGSVIKVSALSTC